MVCIQRLSGVARKMLVGSTDPGIHHNFFDMCYTREYEKLYTKYPVDPGGW